MLFAAHGGSGTRFTTASARAIAAAQQSTVSAASLGKSGTSHFQEGSRANSELNCALVPLNVARLRSHFLPLRGNSEASFAPTAKAAAKVCNCGLAVAIRRYGNSRVSVRKINLRRFRVTDVSRGGAHQARFCHLSDESSEGKGHLGGKIRADEKRPPKLK